MPFFFYPDCSEEINKGVGKMLSGKVVVVVTEEDPEKGLSWPAFAKWMKETEPPLEFHS